MSAVWSTTAGGLPGPAQIALLPEFIAAATTAPPPVTTSSRTRGCFIRAPADSIVGVAVQATALGGPPAFTIAAPRRRTVSAETRFAEGWGLKTTVFPAATMPMELQMIVEEGLVTGVIAPMTPNGSGSVKARPWSP